jgi:hypothetical protein
MIKKITCLLLMLPSLTFADNLGVDDPVSAGWYLGLGLSYNSIRMHQQILDLGPIHVFDTTATLSSFSNPQGTHGAFNETQSTAAPNAQLGYFRPFAGCNTRLWGVKLAYKYLIMAVSDRDLDADKEGSSTNISTTNEPSTISFTVDSSPMHVNHEIDFTAFLGQKFANSFIYVGAGPALFEARPNLYTISGSSATSRTASTINGIGGDPNAHQWVWGGTAQAGMACHLGPTWFIDFNFSYGISTHYNNSNPATFSSDITIDPGGPFERSHQTTNLGSVVTRQKITIQALNITINKVFAS